MLADHAARAAVEVLSEDSVDFYWGKEGCPREQVEQAVTRWAAAYQERASSFYARAEKTLRLG